MSDMTNIKPFLKWAGGKRWLIHRHQKIFPKEYGKYIEPFLGGGAVFFGLAPAKAVLADANEDLVTTYKAIKSDWKSVVSMLKRHEKLHNETYYYQVRSSKPRSPVSIASRLIYLNRTCFNGLYRVNQKGQFNVPKGSKDGVVYHNDNFAAISKTLQMASVVHRDFEETCAIALEGDLLYVDPPYTVKHNSNNFLKYNESIFSWEDQERLAKCLSLASERGAYIIVSNADHPTIHELYGSIGTISRVYRSSVLSGQARYRGKISETIISNC